jgi:hypothetical protein
MNKSPEWTANGGIEVVCGGTVEKVERNEKFVTTIKRIATAAGYKTFRVAIDNGPEIDTANAPLTFEDVKERVVIYKQVDPARPF